MTIPTIFDICRPRPDVLDGAVADADFAADLAQVLTGKASAGYREPLWVLRQHLSDSGPEEPADQRVPAPERSRRRGRGDFRLDTSYGGGKMHRLIALAHASRGMSGASNVAEFIDPGLKRGAASSALLGDAACPVRRCADVDPARRAVGPSTNHKKRGYSLRGKTTLSRWGCCSERLRPWAAARTCAPAPRALRRRGAREPLNGSAWRCIADDHATGTADPVTNAMTGLRLVASSSTIKAGPSATPSPPAASWPQSSRVSRFVPK